MDDDALVCHGTYYGSRGYAEPEMFTVPLSFFSLDEEGLSAAVDAAVVKCVRQKKIDRLTSAILKKHEDVQAISKIMQNDLPALQKQIKEMSAELEKLTNEG